MTTQATAEEAVRTLLKWVGADLNNPHLQTTPQRVIARLQQATAYQRESTRTFLQSRLQSNDGFSPFISLGPIPFRSTCPHHLVPYFGTITVGYIPLHHITGVGHLIQGVQQVTQSLALQEELSEEIATLFEHVLNPQGVIVHCAAHHLCTLEDPAAQMTFQTVTTRGNLTPASPFYKEFFALVSSGASSSCVRADVL